VAHETDPLKIMRALEKEDWLKVLHPHWAVAKVDVPGLNHLLKIRQQMVNLGYTIDSGPAVMYFITAKMNSTDVHAIEQAIPRKSFVQEWKGLEDDAKDFAKRLMGKEIVTNSQAWKFLTAAKPETLLFTATTTKNGSVTRRINDFFGKWRDVRKRLPLPEMAELRITPELPEYPKLAEEVFLLLLDNKLKSQAEIIKFLKPYSPPEPVAPPPPPRRGRAKKAAGAAGVKGKRGRKPATEAPKEGVMVDEFGNPTPLEEAAAAVGKAVGSVVKAASAAAASAKAVAKSAQKNTTVKKAIKAVKKAAPKKAAKAPAKKKTPAKKPAKKTTKKKK
jgi:hypothetical protein